VARAWRWGGCVDVWEVVVEVVVASGAVATSAEAMAGRSGARSLGVDAAISTL
jgi:hypothetical protein